MKIFAILLVASTALLTANFALAQTWTQTSAPSNVGWWGLASSADGNKLVAVSTVGGVYTSTNAGAIWAQQTNAPKLGVVASSADGVKLAAGSFGGIYIGIYTSTNSGNTWTQQTNFPNIVAIASSADGVKLVTADFTEGIYTSTNSGAIWTPASPSNQFWFSLASSTDGTKLVAVGGNNLVGNNEIYLSTNSGSSWIPAMLPVTDWQTVASSADGTKLIAGDAGGGFGAYTSTNSGVTWISNSVSPYSLYCSAVAMSADGSKMVAGVVVEGAFVPVSIYTSTNSGATWQTNNAPYTYFRNTGTWKTVAASADFSKLVAVGGYSGWGIFTSQTTPSPQLNLTPSGSNLTASWIIPSTNFVLQENLDLTTSNWTDVTNPPALNLTNLQDEVVLSPTSSSGFYRLKTP
jgi:hypothetical protein